MELEILDCFASENWFRNVSVCINMEQIVKVSIQHEGYAHKNTLSVIWEVSSLKVWARICEVREHYFNTYTQSQYLTQKLVKTHLSYGGYFGPTWNVNLPKGCNLVICKITGYVSTHITYIFNLHVICMLAQNCPTIIRSHCQNNKSFLFFSSFSRQ